MKKFKVIILALIGILFLTSCGTNENSKEAENLGEKNKIEEQGKSASEESKSKLFIARENLDESNGKISLAEIKGSLSDSDGEKIFKDTSLTDKTMDKSKDAPGDVIISSGSREIKLARESQKNIFNNEVLGKGNSEILESKDNLRDRVLGLLLSNQVRDIETMKNPGDYQVYYTHLLKDFFEDGKLIFLATVVNQNYSYENGIFKQESGYTSPMELRYVLGQDKNFVFDEKIEAMDGAGYGPSIKKMARGDDAISGKLMFAGEVKENYDSLMEELFYLAQEKGLKDFTHKLEEIPGYEKDVVYIEKGPNHIPGTIEIAKKKDYEDAKKNLGKENWTYCEGVVYHKATGIAVKGVIDYFE
ncbi:hypothetical protein [Peptoniphilus vaginalis]|uniref:hypothetical protein n=1 Tax=Peptoniphilus vaginalis TaxID=1756987 RepID=UPI0023F8ABAC|nr:hypothetical protein [Peptoniphilus vaginalis]